MMLRQCKGVKDSEQIPLYVASSPATAKASGGSIMFSPTKTIHAFTSSGSLVIPGPAGTLSCEIISIGGGGGGGTAGGGGGAG